MSTSNNDNAQFAKDVVIIFLAGVAIVVGMVCFVYFLCIIFDRLCYCIPGFQPLNSGATQQFDHGPVARRAGLWGLNQDERMAILERILVGKPYAHDLVKRASDVPNDDENPAEQARIEGTESNLLTCSLVIPIEPTERVIKTHDIENQTSLLLDQAKVSCAVSDAGNKGESTIDIENKTGPLMAVHNDANVEQHPTSTTMEPCTSPVAGIPSDNVGNDIIATPDEGMDILDDRQHETICAICLTEYVEGELVVSGTSCSHLFHKTCAFNWLAKHDHCPFCRKEMMSPEEMRSMAAEVFGEARIVELTMWGVTRELMNDRVEESGVNTSNVSPANPHAT